MEYEGSRTKGQHLLLEIEATATQWKAAMNGQ
jgi:hypothetical protein